MKKEEWERKKKKDRERKIVVKEKEGDEFIKVYWKCENYWNLVGNHKTGALYRETGTWPWN